MVELNEVELTPIPTREGFLMVVTLSAEVAEIYTSPQAHQIGQQYQHKLNLRLGNVGHLL